MIKDSYSRSTPTSSFIWSSGIDGEAFLAKVLGLTLIELALVMCSPLNQLLAQEKAMY